jgi:hypothetical protein
MFAAYLVSDVRGLQAQTTAQAQLLCCSDTDRHHQLTNQSRLPLQQDQGQLINMVRFAVNEVTCQCLCNSRSQMIVPATVELGVTEPGNVG